MSNQNLKQKYEKIYKDGKRFFFSRFENDIDISETDKVVWNAIEWKNKNVIDMEKRLNNAFKDSNLTTEQLPKLIKWLKKIVEEEPESIESLNGSSALYLVNRRLDDD